MTYNEARSEILSRIEKDLELTDEQLKDVIGEVINEKAEGEGMSLNEKLALAAKLFSSIRGLDALQVLLEDDKITEIMINGPNDIFVEKDGRITKYDGQFSSKEKLTDVIQMVVARANRRVNEVSPIVDTRLPDGSRVNVVLDPVAINGPIVTIRKFARDVMSIERLISSGSITKEAAEFLRSLVIAGYNIFVSGGTGSGKTTFLNILSNFIPGDERIITIEDSAELQLSNIDNLVSLEARQANTEGKNEITIRDLIKSALRMRPDRIVVGEIRGGEALDMLQAMNTGHDGSMSTGHANSPRDMLTRIETMVLMGCEMPLEAIRAQIASAIDIIVHLGRMSDKSRKVVEIIEVLGCDGGKIVTNPLFTLKEGALVRTDEVFKNTAKLERA